MSRSETSPIRRPDANLPPRTGETQGEKRGEKAPNPEDAKLEAKALDKRIAAGEMLIVDLQAGRDPRLDAKKAQISAENKQVPVEMRGRMNQLGAEALTQYHQGLIAEAKSRLDNLKAKRKSLGVSESN